MAVTTRSLNSPTEWRTVNINKIVVVTISTPKERVTSKDPIGQNRWPRFRTTSGLKVTIAAEKAKTQCTRFNRNKEANTPRSQGLA